jgi:serine-aspartate repeat-containing protein C/D/E
VWSAPLAALLMLGSSAAPAVADPPTPVFQSQLSDCVTGNNQFYAASDQKFHWWVNQNLGADGSTPPLDSNGNQIKCDNYANDQYERPTDQTYQNRTITQKPFSVTNTAPFTYTPPAVPADPACAPGASVNCAPYLSGLQPDTEIALNATAFATTGTYYEYGDITRGQAGQFDENATNGWLFFRIELFGTSKVSDSNDRSAEFANGTFYSIRLGNNTTGTPNGADNPSNGILLRNGLQQNVTTSWSAASGSGVKIFADINGATDVNNRVGGAGGVDTSKQAGDASGDGYEVDQGNNQWLFVRRNDVTFAGPGDTVTRPTIEFAFNYKKYNADVSGTGTRDFLPPGLTYVEFDSTKGLTDNQNYLWNDEFDQNQAGNPNPGEASPGNDGLENIYQLDSMRYGALPQPGSISGQKFHDLDGDGVKDVGEPGLQNWRIYIDANNNNAFDSGTETSAVTNASGNYSLPNLAAGTYTLREDQNTVTGTWHCSTPDATPGTTTKPVVSADCEQSVTVTGGQDTANRDFGNYQQVAPSGTKYHDLNGDGDQDGGEPGLANWRIYLDLNNDNDFDSGDEPSDVTDSNGAWDLPAQNPGSYSIREDQNTVTGTWICSDPANPDSAPTAEACEHDVTLVSGQPASGLKFGNFQQVAPSGTKYHDLNGDGDQDPGEPGLANWRIYIDLNNDNDYDDGSGSDPAEPSDVTDSNGAWDLPAQNPGPYSIREDQNTVTGTWVCSDPANPDSAPTAEACEHDVTLVSGQPAANVKFGNFQQVAPSGTKYHDLNGDGDQDGGEPGLQNWRIYLDLDEDGVYDDGSGSDPQEPSDVTDANGAWDLPAQNPGSYDIREDQNTVTGTWVCSDPANPDSAPDAAACRHDDVTLVSGQPAANIKFGNFQQVTPSGTKYHDLNGDGDQDNGEPGLANWRIYLDLNNDNDFDSGDEPSDVTDSNGAWDLPAQNPGPYSIREDQNTVTGTWVCSDPANPDSPPTDEACEHDVTLVSGQPAANIKFGNFQQVAPSGTKYHDLNGDGDQDPGEQGLQSWRIYIDLNNDNNYDDGSGSDPAEPSDVTDSSGSWDLPAQNPGPYSIREDQNTVSGTWFCSDPANPDSAPTADACEHDVTLVSGQPTALKFGNFQQVAPSGTKYHDLNGDGDQDPGEQGLQNWRIYIDLNNDNNYDDGSGSDPAEPSDVTDSNGAWDLPAQDPGSFSIREDQNTVTGSWGCSDPSTGDSAPADQSESCEFDVTLVSGTPVSGLKFGNYQNATVRITKENIGGAASDDFNFTPNTALAGESPSPPLSGGKFDLEHGDVQTFTAKPGGSYSAAEDSVTGYRLTEIECDDDDSTDRSDAGGLQGSDRTATLTVTSGEVLTCTFTNTSITAAAIVVKAGDEFAYHGDTVTYNFTVTNPGNGPLHDVQLTDNRCSSIQGPTKQEGSNDTGADFLDPGDTWTYMCQRAVPDHSSNEENPMVNTATVSGVDEFDREVSDQDNHSTRILHPAIDIEKTGPENATAGDTITYTLDVRNTGDVSFAEGNVVIDDQLCQEPPTLDTKNGDSSPGTLDPNDRWTYLCRVQTTSDQTSVDNTASVRGTDDNGRSASDQDSAHTDLAQQEVGGEVRRSGTARLAGRTGCVGRRFEVRVRGREIDRVVFTIDGMHRRVVRTPDRSGAYRITINPRRFRPGAHRVKAVTYFTRESQTRPRVLRLRFQRCVRRAAPRFTG